MFIVFEGIDGSGKTTLSLALYQYLLKNHFRSIWTCEPTFGDSVKQKITQIPIDESVDLFIADRQKHIFENIIPWLATGHIVICDRYWFSTYAYQGLSFPKERIKDFHRLALCPEFVFYCTVDPKVATERAKTKIFDFDTIVEVDKLYQELHQEFGFVSINTGRGIDECVSMIIQRLGDISDYHI